ncbi:LysR family transcriptional regulator [Sinomicrobium pectinilyticum]|uniref:LysR family transcriptional regulator n=1 Tax=Sinomicrobium pectinilyticum TaxID=1084421 RepID=A0A3N0EA55_SINP1|nr:LysR family transcriptional regulator [Sinomicrobium pectinilyticum]RNL84725.1 LysR family transcriptional regulator [Sinomicrobium pectinilyticum]
MVNLEWYRTFKAIYETGTLTGAAQALYASQPGVSLHLSSLESYTGYKLFDRSSRKMVPTERGKVLYNHIKEAIAKLEDAEQCFRKSTEKDKPTISVGMCMETFQYTVEPFISTLPFDVIIKFVEYKDALNDLDKGILDLVISSRKGQDKNIDYRAFSKEKIVLVAGRDTDVDGFEELLTGERGRLEEWLKCQTWYGTTGDMENLQRFWNVNFNKHPDFKCNYIVPNKTSIVRCLSRAKGLAVLPDFLCMDEIEKGNIQLLWEGKTPIENTLYFAMRKKTIYADEIKCIEDIFERKMPSYEPVEKESIAG